jgi:hypothetical protein
VSRVGKHKITRERAAGVVENAPAALGRDHIVDHVHRALVDVFEEGRRTGELEARETTTRTMVAFWEGVELQARGRATEARKDLEALLLALGKVTT